ncbi:ABC transporter ATP-binding protein [Lacrimispora sp.]|uniref:ABC transporter ATP-binding protein n=1 Tax=Lacrimispora sp. TaxID=2719234 RepID=UPI0028B0077A|nr:ABC transporter ATP-binding protein [Lacrimispora sp.]
MAEKYSQQQPKVPTMSQRPGGGRNRFAPTAKPKNAKGTLLRIVKIYMRWGKTIFAAILLTILSSLISVAIPYYLGKTFNTFDITNRGVDSAKLVSLLIIILSFYLINWLLNLMNGVMMLRISQRLVFTLRTEFFEKMQRLPLEFFDTRSHGDTMSRITNDVDNISSTIAQTTTQLISSILTLVGSLAVMIRLNLPLTFMVLLCVPLVSLLTKTIATKSRAYFLAQQRSLGVLNGVIEENILGLKMVKAFDRQEDVIQQFKEINERLCESSSKAQVWSGYMMPLMNVINNFVFAVVAISGGILSVSYGLKVGTVVSFLSYSKQFAQPLNSVAGMFNTIQSALAGAERVFEILDHEEETEDHKDAAEIQHPVGEVSFHNVCFSYDKTKPILKNVNFHVNPGEVIALVGETGAGKTTIVNLLTRFYDADSGEIMIDKVPITHIKRDSLRRCFSVVLQDTSLFSGTIMDNIRYSKNDATEEEVIQAAKIAHAHDFIDKLPKGYATNVSAATDNLSQGQRQLISIARAVLCDSPILILDEATSSVDTKTEKEIQKALVSLMQNRTSFLIAHRLSTIRDADHIMVIGDGQILENGNHQSLMNEKGRYYEMVMSQMGKSLQM